MIFYLLLELFNPSGLPKNINGWVQVESNNYDKENIFDYMDGAGEIYISFNFQKLYVFYYKKGNNEIILDIFEMKKKKNSFGIFSHLRGNGEEVIGLGEEAEIFGNYLIFRKGNYFASISPRDVILKDELLSFGQKVEKYLRNGKGDLKFLNFAKDLKLDLKKIKYFYNMNILNYNYYFISEDLFNFKGGTEGIFSPYKDGYILLLIFLNEKEAKDGLKNLKEKYYGGDFDLKEIENGKWSGYILKDNLLKVFLDFSSKENLIKEINENR